MIARSSATAHRPLRCQVGFRAALVTVALVIAAPLAAVLAAAPATADTLAAREWVTQHSPNATVPGGLVSSMSCFTATQCVAVGSYANGADNSVAFAESWNGKTWHRQTVPVPAGDPSTEFTGVSCTAADFCEAVGDATTSSSPAVSAPLAEAWDGTSWRSQAFPVETTAPDEGFRALAGVSCASATFCEAVGTVSHLATNPVFLADSWNGTSWQGQQNMPASLGYVAGLTGVSCPSSTFCEAVSTSPPSAINWNGKSWTAQSVPGTTSGTLNAVSCVTSQFCEAVGNTGAQWNGITWRTQSVPSAPLYGLIAVSCASTVYCEAVGSVAGTGAVTSVAAAYQWKGSVWVAQATPVLALATSSNLDAVSCASADACEAGGYFSEETSQAPEVLAESWNGDSWQTQHVIAPHSITSDSLAAISCASATFCESVGSYRNSQNRLVNLAEVWRGTSWQLQHPPNGQPGVNDNYRVMAGVSCVSANFCEAVGGDGNNHSAAWLWNGTAWKLQAISSNALGLVSVSCVSEDYCEAVGDDGADVWNGTKWSAQSTAGLVFFGGVSCVSSNFCEAATGAGVTGNEAAQWDGSTWSAQPMPIPSGADSLILSAVSCTAADSCAMVGAATGTNVTQPLVEFWDGTAWTVELDSTSFTDADLDGVSCASAVSCTAVGTSANGSATSGLAEVWDGTSWTEQSTPNGTMSNNKLEGVSCPGAGTCIAVGYSQPGQIVGEPGPYERTLIEDGD